MKTKTPPPSPLQGQYAGFASRFIALIIDLVVVIGAITMVGIVVSLLVNFFHLDQLIDQWLASDNVLGNVLRAITFLGSVSFISFSYFVFDLDLFRWAIRGQGTCRRAHCAHGWFKNHRLARNCSLLCPYSFCTCLVFRASLGAHL